MEAAGQALRSVTDEDGKSVVTVGTITDVTILDEIVRLHNLVHTHFGSVENFEKILETRGLNS